MYLCWLCAVLLESDGFWIRSGGLCPPGRGHGGHKLFPSVMGGERQFVYSTVTRMGNSQVGINTLILLKCVVISPLNLLL